MNSSNNRPNEVDILSMYNKEKRGTVEHTPAKKWLDSLEKQIVLFLGKLFDVKSFANAPPPRVTPSKLDVCFRQKNVKNADVILYNIASIVNQLGGDLLRDLLPMMANLIFMAKQNYSKVQSKEARNMVMKFNDKISAPSYILTVRPEIRLRNLIETVDTMRKYSEFLLDQNDYPPDVGRSPREILRDIRKVRIDSSL